MRNNFNKTKGILKDRKTNEYRCLKITDNAKFASVYKFKKNNSKCLNR